MIKLFKTSAVWVLKKYVKNISPDVSKVICDFLYNELLACVRKTKNKIDDKIFELLSKIFNK